LDYYTSGGTAGCPALLVEAAATNLALHSRDLTNAVWSGTTVTTAKNAVGADGVASGATTITATAASGTVLQALSHASQSRVFSAYIRRVTGTGAIQLTTNGGTNWTTVTISSLYTQVSCAAQTVASGTVGIRLAVSGDVIDVDFAQGEVGPAATSPMATTTGTVTRNADDISRVSISGCIGQTEGTIYAEVDIRALSQSRVFLNVIDSGDSFQSRIRLGITSGNVLFGLVGGGTKTANTATAGVYKMALAYDSSGFIVYVNGTSYGTDAATTALTKSIVTIGSNPAPGVDYANDRIRSAALYTTRLTNDELAALTTL
jgi:hypothetical protein